MVQSFFRSRLLVALLPVLLFFAFPSCTPQLSHRSTGQGQLRLKFSEGTIPLLRSLQETIDTNDFHLTITSEEGGNVYDGTYGNAPEVLLLEAGTYTVRAVSCEFKKPMFATPQYGDEQVVVINSGDSQQVHLMCSQLNAGVQLKIDPDFLTVYPHSALVLKHQDGSLLYSYRERRIAYFRPGDLHLVLTTGAQDKILLTRKLRANDILHLSLSVSGPAPQPSHPDRPGTQEDGLSMEIDTVRHWIYERFVIRAGSGTDEGFGEDQGNSDSDGGNSDEESPGGQQDNSAGSGSGNSAWDAYTVAQAIRHPGKEEVWVHGFIVAGDLTSAAENYKPPFKSKSNLLLAPRAGKCERSSCIAVSLPEGEVREALNLVDNPSLIGKQVSLCGDIVEKYFRITGLKNISAYEL